MELHKLRQIQSARNSLGVRQAASKHGSSQGEVFQNQARLALRARLVPMHHKRRCPTSTLLHFVPCQVQPCNCFLVHERAMIVQKQHWWSALAAWDGLRRVNDYRETPGVGPRSFLCFGDRLHILLDKGWSHAA